MLRVACDNVEMLEEIILVFIGRVDRYAIDMDNALGIVDGMARKVGEDIQRKVGVFVFLGQVECVRVEIAHVYRYVEVRNLLPGCHMPVDFNVPMRVVKRDFPVESSRSILPVELDIVVFVLFVNQRGNDSFDVRLGISVLVPESFQFDVECRVPPGFFLA